MHPINSLNLEYLFRLLYETRIHHGSIMPLLTEWWRVWSYIAYGLTIFFIGAIVYCTVRLNQIREEEEPQYETIEPEKEEDHVEHSRWKHVLSLADGSQESDWRQAIIEADIMLDDVLRAREYPGDTIGERLQTIKPVKFPALEGLWEAHKVRNQIAHEGSAFDLSETLAHRTIARYEVVFREFKAI